MTLNQRFTTGTKQSQSVRLESKTEIVENRKIHTQVLTMENECYADTCALNIHTTLAY